MADHDEILIRQRHQNQDVMIHLEYIREGIDKINERLDRQNGRIRAAEQDIAVLQDRADTGASQSRSSGRNWGAGAGAFIAALLTALWQMFGVSK